LYMNYCTELSGCQENYNGTKIVYGRPIKNFIYKVRDTTFS